jgi:hypothetical protein
VRAGNRHNLQNPKVLSANPNAGKRLTAVSRPCRSTYHTFRLSHWHTKGYRELFVFWPGESGKLWRRSYRHLEKQAATSPERGLFDAPQLRARTARGESGPQPGLGSKAPAGLQQFLWLRHRVLCYLAPTKSLPPECRYCLERVDQLPAVAACQKL